MPPQPHQNAAGYSLLRLHQQRQETMSIILLPLLRRLSRHHPLPLRNTS
jgi:hypothetical protein